MDTQRHFVIEDSFMRLISDRISFTLSTDFFLAFLNLKESTHKVGSPVAQLKYLYMPRNRWWTVSLNETLRFSVPFFFFL